MHDINFVKSCTEKTDTRAVQMSGALKNVAQKRHKKKRKKMYTETLTQRDTTSMKYHTCIHVTYYKYIHIHVCILHVWSIHGYYVHVGKLCTCMYT
jgi:hypothetical protein